MNDPAGRVITLDGFGVHHLVSCGSTMDEARTLARSGKTAYQTVWADEQTVGRGRRGRSWQSPAGAGLYFTTILPVLGPRERLGLGSLAIGVALADAVHAELGVPARLKWPNDLLTPDGRKLAGILLELDGASNTVLAGVGLNLQVTARDHVMAAALEEFGPVNRQQMLGIVLGNLRLWWSRLETKPERVLDAWRERSATLGRRVTVHRADGSSLEGLATDLDDSGALIVQHDGGTDIVSSGEVSLRHAEQNRLEGL